MKALLYTATSLFILMAGVIAYFAVQQPAMTGGARVVLDIDATAMPAVESNAQSMPEPYSNETAPGQDPQTTASGTQQDVQPAAAAPAEPSGLAPRAALDAATSPVGVDEALRPSGAAEQPVDPAAGNVGSLASAPGSGLPGTNLAVPDEPAASPQALRGSVAAEAEAPASAPRAEPPMAEIAALAAKEIEAQEAAAAPPPPPVPVRRPANIPAPGERLAAAEGWGGTQFATTEVAAPKPARVAVLIRGLGRSDQESIDAIAKLPSAVSLAFLPYANESRRLSAQAREKGHEVIVQLPLEPTDYPQTDPGPETLLTTLPPQENATRLQSLLRRFEGHSGVTNLLGGKMLQSKTSLKPLLEEIKARGLVYVGEGNNSHNTVRQVAREINLRYGAAQVMIDAQPTPEAIDKALQRLVTIARERGGAIGMAGANAVTIRQLQAWSETLAAQNITLVPVGALAQAPGAS